MIYRFAKTICLILITAVVLLSGFNVEKIQKALAWTPEINPNYVIDDSRFTDYDSMNEDDIQRFLEEKGSFLKDYTDEGRRASRIIIDAANGTTSNHIWDRFGHPEYAENVKISPKVLLATMQKEEGLVSGYWANPDRWNDSRETLEIRISWAMGYGYTEDPNNIKYEYRGFYNQVNMAAWQLYWNYRRATLGYSDYQVGQTMSFDGQAVHFDNAATASLYRYTPHIQYGFHNNYYEYFGNLTGDIQELNADPYAQTPNPDHALEPNETYSVEANYINAGSITWKKDEVHLGTKDPLDRQSIFNSGNGWTGDDKNRILMSDNENRTGDHTTFRFDFRAPSERPTQTTTYLECFKPVKDSGDKSGWFHNDDQVCWNIPVAGIDQTYYYSYVSQSPSGPDYITLLPGRSTAFNLTVKNTGESTWTRDTVRLGTDSPRDRIPFYNQTSRGNGWRPEYGGNRVLMQEESVAPGADAHFSFDLTLPENTAGGTYREYFRLVADGIAWMEDYGIYYDIKVPSALERYNAGYVTQIWADLPGNDAITMYRGNTYNLSVTFQNNGLETWPRDIVHLGTSRDHDRLSPFEGYPRRGWISGNRIQMEQNSVAPNDYATFSFEIRVPENIPSGEYREYFQPVADGITWMQDYGVYWRIRIP